MQHTMHALLFTWGECVRLNGCSEVSLMEDMREHVQESSEKSCCNLTYTVREMNSIHTLCTRPCNVGTDWKLPYFSIGNAHLMYNVHPKLFTLYFYLSFVITFDLPLIPF